MDISFGESQKLIIMVNRYVLIGTKKVCLHSQLLKNNTTHIIMGILVEQIYKRIKGHVRSINNELSKETSIIHVVVEPRGTTTVHYLHSLIYI